MASHTYTAEELLYMRQKPLREDMHRKLYSRLKRDSELGDMICIRPLASNDQSHAGQLHKPARQEESITRSLPRQLDGTDGEWRYRGRTDSEHAEGQPIPAPSGMVAQKDKGFQRFYKAVVSPTHVRVTAGGRIVPNTRGSVSPGPKWSSDKLPEDALPNDRSTSSIDAFQAYGFPVPPPGFAPMAPIFPGFGPAMMPGMPAGPSPFPLLPWHPSMGFGPGFPMMSNASSISQPQAASGDPRDPTKSDKRSEAGSVKAASIQGPSPEKSQLRHGVQWMMPPAPPFYPMPYPPPQGYAFSQGPQMMVSSGVDMGSQTRPIPSRDSHHSARSAPVHFGPPGYAQGVAIGQSPVSSIRPSEITKNQIGVLRNSLKYLEDQLLYNRHQVDEKAIEHQVDMVKQQIRHFEKNLENQLTFESNNYPKASSTKMHSTRSESSRGQIGSKASIASEDSLERLPYKLNNASSTSLAQSVRSKGGNDKKTSFGTGINSTKSVSAFAPMKLSMRAAGQLESRGGSTSLPVTAALAPPFEPQRREKISSFQPARRSDSRAWSEREQLGSVDSHVSKQDTDSHSVLSESQPIDKRLPYLVGYLPQDVNPGVARDTDYSYTRPLTEDELRARHMYWGNTPRHLQKGLPKFDGKDFYPPSPTKGRSSDRETSSSFSARRLPVGNAAVDYSLSKPMGEAELFRSLEHQAPRATRGPMGIPTQSEALARSSRGTDDTNASAAGYQRAGSCTTRVGEHNSSEEGVEVNVDTSTASLPDKSSSDEAEEDKDLLFKGRRTNRQVSAKSHNNEIWRSMLRKGKTSSNAVPGAVSSTTVQGVLPQYTGYATASLTPAIANSTTPPPRVTLGKAFDVVESAIAPALAERKRENLPPGGPEDTTNAAGRTGASFIAS